MEFTASNFDVPDFIIPGWEEQPMAAWAKACTFPDKDDRVPEGIRALHSFQQLLALLTSTGPTEEAKVCKKS